MHGEKQIAGAGVVAVLLVMTLVIWWHSSRDSSPYGALVRQVERDHVGSANDQWLEMKNLAGKWERVGLVFGYIDDFGACTDIATGLKMVNPVREYRCAGAN